MKKTITIFASILLVLLASGCGSVQDSETVNIPKYDPNKKQEVSTSSTPNNNQIPNTNDTTGEPEFPKATPANNWTMFRRTPDSLGVVDADIKLPLKKNKDQVRLISFSAPQTNEIFGSPAVSDNKLFFGCRIGYISCNKFDTGEPLWRNSDELSPIMSSFAMNDKMVFFGTAKGIFYAWDLIGDNKMWSFSVGDNISAPPGTTDVGQKSGRIIDGPKILDNKVYFGAWDGKMYCLDCQTGKEIWDFPTKSKIYSSPAISNGKLYFTNFKGEVFCLDAVNGKQIWRTALPKGTVSSPIVFGSKLWVGCKDTKLYCLGAKDGKVIWSYQAPSTEYGIECCPIIDEKNVYCTTAGGVAFALDRKTGSEIWAKSISDSSLHADPLLVRNMLIVADLKGKLQILDKSSGKVLDSYNTTGRSPAIYSSPIIIGNQIVFSCFDSNIYILSGQ